MLIYWHIEYLPKILETQNYIRGVHTNWNCQYLNRICGLMEWNNMDYQNLMIYRFINLKSCYLNQFSHMPCEWNNCTCNCSGIYSVALRLVSSVCTFVLRNFVFPFLSFLPWCHVYNVHVLCIWLKVKCQGCVAESKRCCGSNIVELQVLNLHQTYIGLISKHLLNLHPTYFFSQYSHFLCQDR